MEARLVLWNRQLSTTGKEAQVFTASHAPIQITSFHFRKTKLHPVLHPQQRHGCSAAQWETRVKPSFLCRAESLCWAHGFVNRTVSGSDMTSTEKMWCIKWWIVRQRKVRTWAARNIYHTHTKKGKHSFPKTPATGDTLMLLLISPLFKIQYTSSVWIFTFPIFSCWWNIILWNLQVIAFYFYLHFFSGILTFLEWGL